MDLSDLTAGIVSRLQAAQQVNGYLYSAASALVVREDTHDLETEIQRNIGRIGMLILVGQPTFENTSTQLSPTAVLKVKTSVGIGEMPLVWRKANRPHAPSVALTVTQLLHNYKISGFANLRVLKGDFVPDKKLQLYELPIETVLTTPVAPSDGLGWVDPAQLQKPSTDPATSMATLNLGAPTTGNWNVGQMWIDVAGALFRYTADGWVQTQPAVVAAAPVAGPNGIIPVSYLIQIPNQQWAQFYYDGANWKPVNLSPL